VNPGEQNIGYIVSQEKLFFVSLTQGIHRSYCQAIRKETKQKPVFRISEERFELYQ